MPENHKYLQEAQTRIRQFDAEPEAERLREAYLALLNVNPADEHDPRTVARSRAECLSVWLHLVDLLDRYTDPNFDPAAMPETLVEPPPLPGGEVLRPGADPARIEDPAARAAYERAIAANREKAARYRLQIQLGQLKDRIPAGAASFIRSSYSADAGDQTEVRAAIDNIVKDPQRKAELLRLVAPRQR